MLPDTQMYTFSNVHLKIYNQKNKRLLKEIHKKNTITKFALNGIASMIKGEFNDTNYNAINNYVPKYLALGTNNPLDSDPSIPKTITESVSVNDTCLLSEIRKSNRLIRVRLEDVKREENTGDYIQIRFRTMVTSGTISYNAVVQELGLFVNNTSLTSGLFARISTEPLTIPENSILDVTWDVVLASSVGIMPTTIDILNANGEIVSNNQQSPLTIDSYGSYGNIYPLSINLESSVIDGIEVVNSKFDVIYNNINLVWKSTNNFNKNVRTVSFVGYVKNIITDPFYRGTTYFYKLLNDTYIVASDVTESNYDMKKDELYRYGFTISDTAPKNNSIADISTTATEEAIIAEGSTLVKIGTDASNNTINGDNIIANALTFKEVTYRNCTWTLAIRNEKLQDNSNENEDEDEPVDNTYYIIENYTKRAYSRGACVIYNNDVYIAKENTLIDDDPPKPNGGDDSKWVRIFSFIKYMTDCIIINYNEGSDRYIRIGATTYNKITAYTDIMLSGTAKNPDIIIVPTENSPVSYDDAGSLSFLEDVTITNEAGSLFVNLDEVGGEIDPETGILTITV